MAKEVTVHSLKKDSTMALPSDFVATKSLAALAQAFHVYRDRKHPGLAKAKTRGEVSLTTKKMYKQKHTGNARHGAASAPIFVGGGVTHGPKGVKRELILTKSTRAVARASAIAMKVVNKEIAFIDLAGISKTKEAAALVAKTGARSAVVALSAQNAALSRAFRNIKNVTVMQWSHVNAYDLVKNHFLLIDSTTFEKKEVPAKEKKTAVAPKAKVAAKKTK